MIRAEFLDGDDPTREGCMLLDVRMPGLSGPELSDKTRGDEV